MIKIEINNIDVIATNFVKRIEKSVIKNKLSKKEKKLIKDNSLQKGNELQKKIHNLYSSKPEDLKINYNNFISFLDEKSYTTIQKTNLIKKYFDYDTVINNIEGKMKHSYWLMKHLNIRICPYCNRSYTFTINKNNKNIRPEIDHFLPKDSNKYPYLALSFYNLIPSCSICNHTKKTSEIDIHPYIEGFDDKCKFKIDEIEECILNENYDKWNVDFVKTGIKYDNNINIFGLKEFYNQHKDLISEVVFKARAYNDDVYASLIETFSEQGLSPKEMKLLIFGSHINKDEVGLRPLSKLSKDIIEQIGIE